MKKIFALCMAFAMIVNTTSAAFTESKAEKKENYGAFKNAETRAAAEMFVKMSRKDYEEITGRHLSLMERAAFKIQQKHVKKELQKAVGDSEFNIIGLLAGLLLFLLGVLLVYIFSDDAGMRKWAWIGAAISLLLSLGLLVI